MKFFLAALMLISVEQAMAGDLHRIPTIGKLLANNPDAPVSSIFNEDNTTGENLGVLMLPKPANEEDRRFIILDCVSLASCVGTIGRVSGYTLQELFRMNDMVDQARHWKTGTNETFDVTAVGSTAMLSGLAAKKLGATLFRSGSVGFFVGALVMYLSSHATNSSTPNYTQWHDSLINLIGFVTACEDPANEDHPLNWVYLSQDKKISQLKADLQAVTNIYDRKYSQDP